MTFPTVPVTVALSQLLGAVPDGTIVTATLDKDDRTAAGFLVQSSVSGSTAGGVVVLQCFPNNPTTGLGVTGSVYVFTASIAGALWRATAQIPNVACNLHDIAVLPTVPATGNPAWGNISGVLANQTDLQAALNARLPGGSTTQVQYNSGGAFAGNAGFTYNSGTNTLTVANLTGVASAATLASAATALATPRAIDGQNFDGTAPITVIAPGTHAATSKATPVDADELPMVDSAAGNVLAKLTWANLKATLNTYLATLYMAIGPLFRLDANTIEQRNGANAQASRLYNTTDGVNLEYAEQAWLSNNYRFRLVSVGTGVTTRGFQFNAGSGVGGQINLDNTFGTRLSWVGMFAAVDSGGLRLGGATPLIWATNNTADIGDAAGANRPRTAYFGTSIVTPGITTGTVTKTANYTSTASDNVILVDATAGAVTITLEAVSGIPGRRKVVKKIDSSANTVTIDANASELIDGALTVVLSAQWAARSIQVNAGGTAWNVLATV